MFNQRIIQLLIRPNRFLLIIHFLVYSLFFVFALD